MKIEKVIKQLESILNHTRSMAASPDADEIWKEDIDALEFALTALRSMPEAGEPLSLEQLKQMVGKPVWIERIEAPYDGKWFIVNYADTENPDKTLYTDSGVTYSEYGKYFIAYPYPPAHIDRSEWEGCRKCRSCWTCKSAIEPVRAENSKCFLCEDLSNYEPLNFCSHCGRPLTEEAWAELEKCIGGKL